MFYLQKAVINVKRQRQKSLIVVLVCAIIVLFLFLYIGGIQTNRRQLSELPEAMPVYARISNLNGTMTSGGLLIQERVINGLKDSAHVTELLYSSCMGAALGRINKEDVQSMKEGDFAFPLVLSANEILACSALSAENIDFMDGAGPECLESEEALCIIRDKELQKYELAVGDNIWLTLFYNTYPSDRYDLTYKWLGIFEVKIAGCYTEAWDTAEEGQTSQIIFPAKWIEKLHKDAEIMFFADSARFRVADPLEINAFKAEMKGLNLMSVISQAEHSHRGIALTVNDETFIRAASRLEGNITLMQVFTPFILVAVGLVGFVVSYMLMHGRKPEIAVMRSLGMSQKSCFILLFTENAMLDLLGSALGILLAALFTGVNAALTAVVVALFFVCYISGTAVALKLIGKFSVMAVLSALE